ncbi:MAG: methionine--tRNA ligase [Acidobacteria bacterium]|nr:methionine--tRNA ligase [Acidobacteriota bacterium]
MAKFYLTTPLYYVNAAPHLGHAYSTLVADTIRRFKRMQGIDAFLLTGTDEHGQNIERIARDRGIPPQQHCDENNAVFRALWEKLGIGHDTFIRTTEDRHKQSVLALWARLLQGKTPDGQSAIYRGKYGGWYCQPCEVFKDETELRQPGNICPDHDRPCEWTEEENYFFRLSAYQNALLAHYETNPDFIRPETRRNEVTSFVKSGLRDLSISRSTIKWGIPVPKAAGEASGSAEHVFYVWLDALTGYMSGIGYGQDGAAGKQFEKLWPADVHLVGKEILRFHTVYWPAFLMAAGLPLPGGVFAHGWLLFEESKMSKSRGNVVRAEPIVDVLGIDPLRYFLLREVPFGNDGNFSFDSLVSRYNSDLANDLGNLSSRVLAMITRYFHGEIPYASAVQQRTAGDRRISDLGVQVAERYQATFSRMEFGIGLEAVWELVAAVNKYLVEMEPWTLAERGTDEDLSRLATILYTSAEALRLVTGLLWPVIPNSAEKIWRQLGLSSDLSALTFDQLVASSLDVGSKIGKVEPVFPRLIKAETLQKLSEAQEKFAAQLAAAKLAAASSPASPEPASPEESFLAPLVAEKLTIDEFVKWDLRVGEVRVAERIKGASKLLRLEIDIGVEVRQVLAGIAEFYEPEQLIGRKVVILANLQPRKMRGLESNGMLLAASVGKEDRPVLMGFADNVFKDVPNGARLR